jgi:hypothetical protein
MRTARRIPIPVLLAGAVACCGVLTGPASASQTTAAATSYGVAPAHVMLNPQPLPPRIGDRLSLVGLNPQPLPPRYLGGF